MADTPPQFPPPAGPVPPVVPPAAETSSPAPYYFAAPVAEKAPWSTGRKVIVGLSIGLGSLAVLGAIVVGIVAIGTSVIESIDDTPGNPGSAEEEPLQGGEPGRPTAADPTDCPDACFTGAAIGSTIADEEAFEALGLTEETFAWGDTPSSTVQYEYSAIADRWVELDGTPNECFFTLAWSPIAIGFDERPGQGADSVYFTGSREDSTALAYSENSVRLFADSASAVDHMTSLSAQIPGCPDYEMGTGAEYWAADVLPMPAIDIPGSVAVVGWIEQSLVGRYFVADIQRSNLVVRTTLSTSVGGSSEADFHAYVEHLAEKLAAIEPTAE